MDIPTKFAFQNSYHLTLKNYFKIRTRKDLVSNPTNLRMKEKFCASKKR